MLYYLGVGGKRHLNIVCLANYLIVPFAANKNVSAQYEKQVT